MLRGSGERSIVTEFRQRSLSAFVVWTFQGVVYVLVRLCRSLVASVTLSIGNLLVAVALLPHDAVITYWTLVRTRVLGRNVKILALLLLLVPLVAWPFAVLTASVIGGPVLVIFGQVVYGDAFQRRPILLSALECIKDFASWNYDNYFGYLREFRERAVEKPYDISLLHLAECIFAGVLGMLVDGTLVTALALRSFFPILWFNLRRTWSSEGILSRKGAVFFSIIWPFILLAMVLMAMLGGFVAGLGASVIVWEEQDVHMGFKYIVAAAAEFDEVFRRWSGEDVVLLKPSYSTRASTASEMFSFRILKGSI
ncbi:hypothetical protein KFL_000760190 [Klebsormidium nitens]|uniref:Transmembrane protein n=1 Tax=Klebsormidium nitens TaxID=105231 RepID=A0A1Y1HRN5_KLENI|nr:hypothetical protein KFL_000760190 [Klebsormidium nitens]|eukprot:GAQ81290.1 hypothetical protein KFL_000760190 [Klebsormidium nitens]